MTRESEMVPEFPASPNSGTALLTPIRSWSGMVEETAITGVEFDAFWYESVMDGVAYFFRWIAHPRATVLVVWNARQVTHVECRHMG